MRELVLRLVRFVVREAVVVNVHVHLPESTEPEVRYALATDSEAAREYVAAIAGTLDEEIEEEEDEWDV